VFNAKVKRDTVSKLRQELGRKISQLEEILKPAFEAEPVFPGSLHLSRHRCGKAQCRCNQGILHEALRLQIRFEDGVANRCLGEEEAAFWRPRTEAYRRTRKASRAFAKWQREVASLLDSLERARRSTEGLEQEDRRRALR
jgi:hypothetical protein